jgi:chemotaxis protein methyltransferase CheR
MHLFPDVSLEIVATDIDEKNISRATTGCFPMSSLREIPTPWLSAAFCQQGDQFCLAPEIMKLVKFYALDIKHSHFDERFDLICCRNLIFTYFDIEMQQEILQRITGLLHPAGFLVIGCHENLPPVTHQFQRSFSNLPIYQKKGAG